MAAQTPDPSAFVQLVKQCLNHKRLDFEAIESALPTLDDSELRIVLRALSGADDVWLAQLIDKFPERIILAEQKLLREFVKAKGELVRIGAIERLFAAKAKGAAAIVKRALFHDRSAFVRVGCLTLLERNRLIDAETLQRLFEKSRSDELRAKVVCVQVVEFADYRNEAYLLDLLPRANARDFALIVSYLADKTFWAARPIEVRQRIQDGVSNFRGSSDAETKACATWILNAPLTN